MITYLETSAAAKLLVTEVETATLAAHLDQLSAEDSIASSVLLETELRRLAVRESLPQQDVSTLLRGIRLLQARRQVFQSAGLLPEPSLRSLDALHLASAILDGADVMITYDQRLIAAAEAVGMTTESPR